MGTVRVDNTWYDEIASVGVEEIEDDSGPTQESDLDALYRKIDEALSSLVGRSLVDSGEVMDLLLDLRQHTSGVEMAWKALYGMWWQKVNEGTGPLPSNTGWKALGKRLAVFEMVDRDVLARYAGNGKWELGEVFMKDAGSLIVTEGLFSAEELRRLAELV